MRNDSYGHSIQYKSYMQKEVRNINAYIDLEWWDGLNLQLASITRNGEGSYVTIGAIKSIKLRSSTGGKVFGTVINQQMILEVMLNDPTDAYKLENGRFLTLQIGPIGTGTDTYTCNAFYNKYLVESVVQDTQTNVWTVNAWDFMKFLEVSAAGKFNYGTAGTNPSISDIVADIAGYAQASSSTIIRGVNTSVTFGDSVIQNITNAGMTIKDVLKCLADLTGTIAFMTMDTANHPVLKLMAPYVAYDRTDAANDIISMNAGVLCINQNTFSLNMQTNPTWVYGLVYKRDGANVSISVNNSSSSDGYIMDIGKNNILAYMVDHSAGGYAKTYLQTVINSYYASNYNSPFYLYEYDLDWRGMPLLEPTDFLVTTNWNILTYLECNLDYDGGLREDITFRVGT